MEQWRESSIVQVYHPGFMGRVGPVIGREGDRLLVLIDGKAVKVEPSKAVPVKAGSESNEHRGAAAGTTAKAAS